MTIIKAEAQITISHLVDIVAIIRYYLLQSSTISSPNKPTTNPPPSPWKTTEPSYTSGSTNTLYLCDLTEFSDGTFAYSLVSKSSSYEAAKEAYNKAVNAQSTAGAAKEHADDAAKTATDYLSFSSSGLVVGDMTASSLGKNVLIDSDSVDVRNGNTTLASFGANKVTLGQNNANSEINLCDGAGKIRARISGASTSYPKYDSIEISSQEINLECKSFDSRTSYKASNGYLYESSHKGLSSSGGFAGISSMVTAPVNSSGVIYMNETGLSSSSDDALNQTKTWLYAKQDKEVNNTISTVKSNAFYIYTDYVKTTKPLRLGPSSIEITGDNKTLWSGAWYMQAGQTATLSESVLEQYDGISLIFSLYSDNTAKNQEFFSFFIPKIIL